MNQTDRLARLIVRLDQDALYARYAGQEAEAQVWLEEREDLAQQRYELLRRRLDDPSSWDEDGA